MNYLYTFSVSVILLLASFFPAASAANLDGQDPHFTGGLGKHTARPLEARTAPPKMESPKELMAIAEREIVEKTCRRPVKTQRIAHAGNSVVKPKRAIRKNTGSHQQNPTRAANLAPKFSYNNAPPSGNLYLNNTNVARSNIVNVIIRN